MKIAAEGEATTGATGAETTDVAAEGEATTGAAGAETMDVAAEGEATTGAAGAETMDLVAAAKVDGCIRSFRMVSTRLTSSSDDMKPAIDLTPISSLRMAFTLSS